MFATLNDTNKVIGYSKDPWMTAIELTDQEYIRQISSNGYFLYLGNDVFEEHAFEPPEPTQEEINEAALAQQNIQQQKAIRELALMQAVALIPQLSEVKVFNLRYAFPQWRDLIGTQIFKSEIPYIMYNDDFYMVNQDHLVQAEWVPGTGTESLYSKVAQPGAVATWVQPLGAHDAYNSYGSWLPKSDPVTHNGSTWISSLDGNIWEPGVYGWVIYTG
ncbi:hypothetical protein [Proteiniclasticum sp. QWL-01]|uniref:hypothetical protein n=1 Tax=Proteiniclasticum sp. QWL-01 TaxID=3036945 RepID=UPI00240EC7A2|nr:hypothetical protein [Proteiniclasticum sp. QWL-01]WFF72662.1 hypothetical protein P6M73_15540 [Proteiniclasticum sp. QWL-01]